MTHAPEHLGSDEQALSREEFARIAGVTPQELQDLIDYGLLAADDLRAEIAFALRAATRLRGDFDLDLFTTGMIAAFLSRIEDLEEKVRQLHAERPAHVSYTEVSVTSVQLSRTT